MRKRLLTLFVGLLYLGSFAQTPDNKLLIGASINYSHENMNNNSLLTNILNFDENYAENFEVLGEINYCIKQNQLIGLELGFASQKSRQKQPADDVFDESKTNTTVSGILLNPKYKFIKDFSEKVLLYTDFKVMLHYYKHNNEFTQIDYSNRSLLLNMNGKEFSYGFGVNPGLILKISQNLGLKFDYSLFSISHSTIKKADDSDIDFDKINAWDYNLNMSLAELNIGIVFTL